MRVVENDAEVDISLAVTSLCSSCGIDCVLADNINRSGRAKWTTQRRNSQGQLQPRLANSKRLREARWGCGSRSQNLSRRVDMETGHTLCNRSPVDFSSHPVMSLWSGLDFVAALLSTSKELLQRIQYSIVVFLGFVLLVKQQRRGVGPEGVLGNWPQSQYALFHCFHPWPTRKGDVNYRVSYAPDSHAHAFLHI